MWLLLASLLANSSLFCKSGNNWFGFIGYCERYSVFNHTVRALSLQFGFYILVGYNIIYTYDLLVIHVAL